MVLDTPDDRVGRDLAVVGVPGKHVVGSLLAMAAGRPTVLFHQQSETVGVPFQKFGKPAVTAPNMRTLEILLASHNVTIDTSALRHYRGSHASVHHRPPPR